MPSPEPTEITITEQGDEFHESWLLVRANRVSCSPGAKLFDSEIRHQHYITVVVSRCTRKRDLNRDWLNTTRLPLIEFDLSEAQWGAFVSSFGNGAGVPATLAFFENKPVPGVATNDSRLDKSHQEVKGATARGMAEVRKAQEAVNEAFARNAGKREMRDLLSTLSRKIDQMPGNMEFAAKALTEHVENVVQKARSDIEGMAANAAKHNAIEGKIPNVFELEN